MNQHKIDYKQVEKRRKVLDWFHNVQLAKLLVHAGKGTWENDSIENLIKLLKEEIKELEESIKTGNIKNGILECGDIANFATFIADILKNKGVS